MGFAPLPNTPLPKSQVKTTLVPVATVAVKAVTCPKTVGLLLKACRPLSATSVTVTTVVAGKLARSALSVTTSVKESTAGVAGAVKVVTLSTGLKVTAGPPLCCQP